MLFQDIARLRNLQVLALPQWDEFVGKNVAVLVPLSKLDKVTVLVHESTKSSTISATYSLWTLFGQSYLACWGKSYWIATWLPVLLLPATARSQTDGLTLYVEASLWLQNSYSK